MKSPAQHTRWNHGTREVEIDEFYGREERIDLHLEILVDVNKSVEHDVTT
jgi:hypothetical protein